MNSSSETLNFEALATQFRQVGEALSTQWQATKAQAAEYVASNLDSKAVAGLSSLFSELRLVAKASPSEALALASVQKKYAELHVQLLKQMAAKFGLDEAAAQATLVSSTDKRFSDPAWSGSPVHAYQAQAYVLATNAMLEFLDCVAL